MLPDPMLARSGPLPTRPGWSFEPKWDGFRAIVRTGDDYTVRSRRGWLMTEHLPEFASLSIRGVFDGELVAFGNDGKPSFDRICRRILQRDRSVPVALVVFDLLDLDGDPTMRLPYRHRRELLESLDFAGCQLCPRFDDAPALWQAVQEHRLEGVVAKKLDERYRPGERTWIKRKNPEWPRYEAERPGRSAAARSRAGRCPVRRPGRR
jgi:bifunctional non-homologous end joining protein LigD